MTSDLQPQGVGLTSAAGLSSPQSATISLKEKKQTIHQIRISLRDERGLGGLRARAWLSGCRPYL